MASIAAAAVAKEVQETIGRGKMPNISKIAIKKGYAVSTALSGEVQATKTFKKALAPFAARVIKHREVILKRMEATIDEAEYNELSSSLERTTKVIQLLTGGATDHVAVEIRFDPQFDASTRKTEING